MNTHIWTLSNALDADFCQHCISKFEENSDQHLTGAIENGVLEDVKKSTDLLTTVHSNWQEEQTVFHRAITEGLDKYRKYLDEHVVAPSIFNGQVACTGYQIQRTKPDEYYHWHSDFVAYQTHFRFLTYIFYLNTLKDRGGETEFLNGPKVRPVTGKLLIFPASWDCVHRGVSPVSETKYIATGWVCNVPKSDPVIPQKVDFSDAFYLQ